MDRAEKISADLLSKKSVIGLAYGAHLCVSRLAVDLGSQRDSTV
jgi:hypothetical protein